jgi:hypothetical protein
MIVAENDIVQMLSQLATAAFKLKSIAAARRETA